MPTPPPAAVKPAPTLFIGGGQPILSDADRVPKSFTIRMNVNTKTSEREGSGTIPIYEFHPMRRLYLALGHDLDVDPSWIPNYSRVCPLSQDMLNTEMKRLSDTYRRARQAGGFISYYEQVYGTGAAGIKRFYEVITLQAKAWKLLDAKIQREQARRLARGDTSVVKITMEELKAIVDIALPPTMQIESMPHVDMPDSIFQDASAAGGNMDEFLKDIPESADPDAVREIDDPLVGLKGYLMEQGWDMSVVSHLDRMVRDDGVDLSATAIRQIPAIKSSHGSDKGAASRLLRDIRVYQAKVAQADQKDIDAPAAVMPSQLTVTADEE